MSAFAAAIDTLFADPNLAVDALWRAGGEGEGVPVRVITRRPDELVTYGHAVVHSATMLIDVRTSEVPELAAGDTFELGGELHVVQGTPRRDRRHLRWLADVRPAPPMEEP